MYAARWDAGPVLRRHFTIRGKRAYRWLATGIHGQVVIGKTIHKFGDHLPDVRRGIVSRARPKIDTCVPRRRRNMADLWVAFERNRLEQFEPQRA